LATASCDLWQKEQRRFSSVPVRDFISSPPTPRHPTANGSRVGISSLP